MKDKLKKEAFCPNVLDEVVTKVESGELVALDKKDYALEILHKMQEDFVQLPKIYQKYCEDIRFACKNGLNVDYQELAGYVIGESLSYEVFDGYFKDLKKLVKEYEMDMNVVLDLVSAKDRMESVRVILLEAEANLKKLGIV